MQEIKPALCEKQPLCYSEAGFQAVAALWSRSKRGIQNLEAFLIHFPRTLELTAGAPSLKPLQSASADGRATFWATATNKQENNLWG